MLGGPAAKQTAPTPEAPTGKPKKSSAASKAKHGRGPTSEMGEGKRRGSTGSTSRGSGTEAKAETQRRWPGRNHRRYQEDVGTKTGAGESEGPRSSRRLPIVRARTS